MDTISGMITTEPKDETHLSQIEKGVYSNLSSCKSIFKRAK